MEQKEKNDALYEEQWYLEKVFNVIKSLYDSLNNKISNINSELERIKENVRYGIDFERPKLDEYREERKIHEKDLNNLNKVKDNPYFGRLAYNIEGKNDYVDCYIGFKDITDSAGKKHVMDWRSPAGDLFYGRNTYKIKNRKNPKDPVKNNKAKIKLCRHIKIENKKVVLVEDKIDNTGKEKYYDQYLNDILSRRKASPYMKDIVATIQSKQNEAIRIPLNENLVLTGVAGSGKTSVVMHRIAYLIYTYHDQLKPEDILVLAPGQMFLNYIHSLLPFLDEKLNKVDQLSFNQFLKHSFGIENAEPLAYKKKAPAVTGTERWAKVLDKAAEKAIYNSITSCFDSNTPININGKGNIVEIYPDTEQITEKLSNIAGHEGSLWRTAINRVKNVLVNQFIKNAYKDSFIKKEDRKKVDEEINHAEEKINNLLKITVPKPSPGQVYNSLMSSPARFVKLSSEILSDSEIDEVIEYARDFNPDLPSTVWLSIRLGEQDPRKYKIIMLDEAQDISELELKLIKHLNKPGGSLTLTGDPDQSFYYDFTRGAWLELAGNRLHIDMNYRNSNEIANYVARRFNTELTAAGPEKKEVEEINVKNLEEAVEYITICWDEVKAKHNMIAVITKTATEAHNISKYLTINGITNRLILEDKAEKIADLIVSPVELIRGIEFDAVFLYDTFNMEDTKERSKAYIACTRAHHELYVFQSKDTY